VKSAEPQDRLTSDSITYVTRRNLREYRSGSRKNGRRRYVALATVALLLSGAWVVHDQFRPAPASNVTLDAAVPVAWNGSGRSLRQTFSKDVAGSVTGVKFRQTDNGPTKYLASLWSPDGSLLSFATTGAKSADGWLTAQFPKAVPIDADVEYTVLYWASPNRAAPRAARGADVVTLFTAGGAGPSSSPRPTVSATPTHRPTVSPTPRPTPKPTSTPTPTKPSEPAGAFPDKSTTGVPAGTSLKASGDLTVTKAGTVIDGYDVNGVIQVNASNVTIKNTRIRGRGWSSIRVKDDADGVVIQDCEIDGRGTSGNENSMGVMGPAKVLRCDIHGVENGVTPGSGSLIEDNYIHDLGAPGAPHYDGIQIDGGLSDIVIRHNTVINDFSQTSAVMIDNYFGPIRNITVERNYLAGGGYTVYSSAQFNGGTVTGVKFLHNTFEKGYWGFASIEGNSVVDTGNVDVTAKPMQIG
jgi:hypothetical protein